MPELSKEDVGNLQIVLNNTASVKLSVDNALGPKTLAELRRQAALVAKAPPGTVVTKAPPPKPDEHLDHTRVLWLTAGHGGSDSGAVAHGHSEAALVLDLRNLITEALKNKGFKYTIWNDPDGWATPATAAYIQSKTKEHDLVFDLHFNAAGPTATGVEVIVPDSHTTLEKRSGQSIAGIVHAVLGIPLRGDAGVKTESETPRGRLAMMRPPGTNVLLETAFISNSEDLEKYFNGKHRLADEIANWIITFFNVT